MRKLLFSVFALSLAIGAHAKEYGTYDPQRLLTVSETPSGKKYNFDGAYLDHMLNDLSAHAKNYPPQFDTPEDKQRAAQDVKTVSGMLDILIDGPKPDRELLLRAGYLNSIGHNLEVPGSAAKANAIFKRLLAAAPADPRGNYIYGTFLAGVGKSKDAIPYLEKALAGGVNDAAYAIGMAHLFLGDKEQAIKSLEDYRQRKPSDERVGKLIDGIRSGKIEVKKN